MLKKSILAILGLTTLFTISAQGASLRSLVQARAKELDLQDATEFEDLHDIRDHKVFGQVNEATENVPGLFQTLEEFDDIALAQVFEEEDPEEEEETDDEVIEPEGRYIANIPDLFPEPEVPSPSGLSLNAQIRSQALN